MKTTLHKADSRGHADHGWLQSFHSFSFANYHNPERMNFGVLRVLNDDTVAGGKGFGRHPHDNMEIISVPLAGKLRHADSMGNSQEITTGEIQLMSAGTGVVHSEHNASDVEPVKFLQIWIMPKSRNIAPRYDQRPIAHAGSNEILLVASPLETGYETAKLNQDAYLSLANLENHQSLTYDFYHAGNGLYAFVLEGSIEMNEEALSPRDGMGVWEAESIAIKSTSEARVLLIEVPMNIN